MNKKKIFGIGAVIFLLMLTIAPLTQAQQKPTAIKSTTPDPGDPQPLLSVPYRSQWELLPDVGAWLTGCGPACAAMLEEDHTGNHPTLRSVYKSRPMPSTGWTGNDIEDYLETATGLSFTYEYKYFSNVDDAIDYIKNIINSGKPVIILMKTFFGFLNGRTSNHWQVIHSIREDGTIKAFKVHDPFYRGYTELHYYSLGLLWWVYWPNTQNVEDDAWGCYNNHIHIIY